jgi:DNA-binding transcriptional LysR family regulator
MRCSPAQATRHVAGLEKALGQSLLQRTTRRVSLTPAGGQFLLQVRPAVQALEAATSGLRGRAGQPLAGPLRVAAPRAAGVRLLTPVVADFVQENPGVVPHCVLLDRSIDPDAENFDVVMEAQPLGEGSQEPVILLEWGLYAAPTYLARKGRPHGVSDLPQHDAIVLDAQRSWALRGGEPLVPRPALLCNDIEAVTQFCVSGLGLALLPKYMASQRAEGSGLQLLLDGFEPKPDGLFLRTPRFHLSGETARAFHTFLTTRLKRLRF